jgi:hypothetical protein
MRFERSPHGQPDIRGEPPQIFDGTTETLVFGLPLQRLSAVARREADYQERAARVAASDCPWRERLMTSSRLELNAHGYLSCDAEAYRASQW